MAEPATLVVPFIRVSEAAIRRDPMGQNFARHLSKATIYAYERIGDGPEGIEVWEGSSPWRKDRHPEEVWAYLYDRQGGVMVGVVGMVVERDIAKCGEGFSDVVSQATDRSLKVDRRSVYRLHLSHLDPRYRGRGAGVALYLGALAAAAKAGRAVLADACFEDGSTSADAQRVWRSEALAERALVSPDYRVALFVA